MNQKAPLNLFDRRSLLFLPASNPRAIARARSSDADLVILDLEDAVKPAEKADARRARWPLPISLSQARSPSHHVAELGERPC